MTLEKIRLKSRRLAVINAANVCADDRKPWIELARRCRVTPVAIVLDPGAKACVARNRTRPDIVPNPKVAIAMSARVRDGLHKLPAEGYRQRFILDSQAAINAASIVRKPLQVDRRTSKGPFDILVTCMAAPQSSKP